MPSRKPKIDVRREPTRRKGPVKHSKRVNDRIKAAGALRGSIEGLKDDAGAGFDERLAGELRAGEVMPDQSLALELAVRSVMTQLEELVAADDLYCHKMVQRRHLEKACRVYSQLEVYPKVRDLRRQLESLFGKEAGCALHGLKGPTRRKAKRLQPQLEFLVSQLKKLRNRKLPPLRVVGVPSVDPDAFVDQLEPACRQLTRMLSELTRREIAEDYQRKVKDIAIEDFDTVYGEALDFVRSVFGLAGFGDKEAWYLLPNVERRRLKREARGEREARADGRREASGEASAGGPVARLRLGRRPVNVA